MLDKQLSVGPLNLNIADLGLTDDIQDKLDDVPKIIQSIVAMYIIAAIFIILALFGSCAAVALIPNPAGRKIVMGNLGLAGGAFFFLLIGNLITTIGSGVVVDKVNDLGDKFGLSAVRGGRFMALSWAALVLMLLVVIYWVYEITAEKKRMAENNRAHDRAIGGYDDKSAAGWSETDSVPPSREDSYPQGNWDQQQYQAGRGGEYQQDHEYPSESQRDLVSPMSTVNLEEDNYGRGTNDYQPQPYSQPGYGR